MTRTFGYLERLYSFVKTRIFFALTLVLFFIQAVWLALTAVYPLPFDEYYHFGLTKLYASQWLPFIQSQPPEVSLYGDITRDPSYMYHYLMSFPYRLFDMFTDSQMVLVIALRLINIAFVVWAIILFRRLLITWNISRAKIHLVIAIFVVTPIVPLLAAHNNYDNLLLVVCAYFLLQFTKIYKSKKFVMSDWVIFVSLAMFGALNVGSMFVNGVDLCTNKDPFVHFQPAKPYTFSLMT